MKSQEARGDPRRVQEGPRDPRSLQEIPIDSRRIPETPGLGSRPPPCGTILGDGIGIRPKNRCGFLRIANKHSTQMCDIARRPYGIWQARYDIHYFLLENQ